MAIASVNPATGQLVRSFEPHTAQEVETALANASATFGSWRHVSFGERAALLERAAGVLERESSRLASLITLEMGKPIGASVAEVLKSAKVCRYYAEHGERYLADEHVQTQASSSFIRYQPLGVVLAVMPWNFPFWQVFRFAAPALMAGNVALLKHSSNVPQSALAIEDVFREAGFPAGTFKTLLIGADRVSELLADDRIAAATLTGSEPAGSSVAAESGRHIRKTVLELGGSDPFIVTPSANIEEAVKVGVKARNVNNGQSCIAAKRFILFEEIAEQFTSRFVEIMKGLRIGDPSDESTDIGPLATEQILTDLEGQVDDAVAAGARLLTGGKRIGGAGNFYPPTVLADIPENARAFREELFGPVAAMYTVRSVEEAIALANDSSFGLGASVWTRDPAMRDRFVNEIETGLVFINAMVASDPRMPFGGVKHSGYGRELGEFGIREFVNIKTVWIEDGAGDVSASE